MASKEKSNAQKKPQQSPKPAPEAAPEHDASDLFETRLRKLEEARASQNPYDISYQRKNTVSEPASVAVDSIAEGTPGSLVVYNVAGRVRAKRLMGKAGFLDLEDETGRLQIYGTEKDASLDFNTFVSLDLGDIAGFEGTLFVTRTGQISLRATKMTLLAKCLRPLPVVKEADGKVFDAFTDKESRYRMRYVDLIVNPHVRKTFLIRSQIVSQIRSFLNAEGYLEVETPMMHPIPGGASAKPFTTHHNALDMELFLRIAPELYLKRLLVGGFSKVYEINRNFRNEGISFKHNPEFTMLELYEAYGDMNSMLDLCERLFVDLAERVIGTTKLPFEEDFIELKRPWERLTYFDAIKKYAKIDLKENMTGEQAVAAAKAAGLRDEELAHADSVWTVAECIFDARVEEKLMQPVFITHHPIAVSPLAKADPANRNFALRFETYIAGRELCNAFSELNDPIDQKARFQAQVELREKGSEGGGYMDHDYIRALEYGMPPAGGMGIGIDRLVMLFTNSHTIRDVILFPVLRPETAGSD